MCQNRARRETKGSKINPLEHEIRRYRDEYRRIGEIYADAVRTTAAAYYSPAQIDAWAPLPIDFSRWKRRCEHKRPWLDVAGSLVRGFIELDPDGHIDCHYVDPEYSRQGIGSALLDHVLRICRERKLPRAYVEASHVAKGLYLKHGFRVIRPNTVRLRGVSIANWVMEKRFG